MAYKKVIEMLGENLASFLELAKKWLVDWSVETKKLLHTFHNLKKEDLLGLIAGTHEIKAVGAAPTSPVSPEKFALLVDLGIFTVPDDFIPEKCLAEFHKKNCKKFYGYNKDITDLHFSNPTRILKPGDKLRVKAFKQIVSGITTSEERMAFLATQKAVHLGAQGVTMVFDQKKDQLIKGYWYCSFDEKDRLWKDSGGSHRVPYLCAHSDGDFNFRLGYFEHGWDDSHAILCFCDEELGSSET